MSRWQSGNRKHFSTDELLKNTLGHDPLLLKLPKAGLSDCALAWFKSNLFQRNEVVRIENALSKPLPLSVGVALGSILGPVLFTLYMNDLTTAPKYSRVLGYVDDSEIFLSVPPSYVSDIVSAANKDLADITRWCCINSLLINPNKTKLLFVGLPQLLRSLQPLLPVMLLGQEIKPVSFT